MDDDDRLEEVLADLNRTTGRILHLVRLGGDAVQLLARCWDEADLPPDLSVEVGNFLLRLANMKPPEGVDR